jgi:hypothetical protein
MVKTTTNDDKPTTKKARAVRKEVKTRRSKPDSKSKLAVPPQSILSVVREQLANGPPVWGYKVKTDFVAYDKASCQTLEAQFTAGVSTEFTLVIGSTPYSILNLQNAPTGLAKQKREDTGYQRRILRSCDSTDFRDRVAGDNFGTGSGRYSNSFGKKLNAPLAMIEAKEKVAKAKLAKEKSEQEIVEID